MNQPSRIIAVSNPGGLAKQYRIQYRSSDQAAWRQSTTAGTYRQAESAVHELQNRGLQARIIHYRVPTAA